VTPRPVIVAVAVGLVATMLVGIIGIIVLAVLSKPTPDILANVTLTVVGAVAGLLARTGSDATPQDVQVVNRPNEPIPVEPGA
jgi:hypothetical protein